MGAKISIATTPVATELANDGLDTSAARVNLPRTPAYAGFAQKNYVPATGLSRVNKVSVDGDSYFSKGAVELSYNFNAGTSTQFDTIWGNNATTMTIVAAANYIRLNNSAITTTTTGCSIYSWQVFKVEDGSELRVRFFLKHTNVTATSKQAEFGLGYYAFGTGQAAQMNEFIGFRFTTAGGLNAVLGESVGGAPAEQTATITPLADSVFYEYELVIDDTTVQYWVNGVYQTTITRASGSSQIVKSSAYPFIGRVFNSGAASAAATFDIGTVTIVRYGGEEDQEPSARQALMKKASYYPQPDLLIAGTSPQNFPASGTAPTTAVGSNTASVLNNTALMGGLWQMTGTTITATVQSNFLISAWLNPAIPTAAGVATNARNFILTGIHISPMVVGTVLVGGGFVAIYFLAVGQTAVSLATTDADGTTAVAQKAPRLVVLPLTDSLAAAAAVGTVATRVGSSSINFKTPVVVSPGEYLSFGIRTLQVTAAVTSGNLVGGFYPEGYWE